MNRPATPLHAPLPELAPRAIPAAFMQALQARFGSQCATAQIVREQHGRDESAYAAMPPPDAVVFAESTQDVSDALQLAISTPCR